MSTAALLTLLGEAHVDRETLPDELERWVDNAISRGVVFEDCRGRLVSVASN